MRQLDDAVEVEKQRRYLPEFVKGAWDVVEPATPMAWGFHIDAICEVLEAAARQEIKKLVINIPPRHMKSLLVTVFWPAWVWTTHPSKRFMFSSYADSLAVKHSVACRRVIQHDWYQQRWGHVYQLHGDQNAKSRFENDKTGFRLATSVGGMATGEGGDFIIVDDPHKALEVESDVAREAVIDWWDQTMSTRLNDPKTGVRVIIMQRLHENDLTGHVLEKGDWHHLCLPAEYEPSHPFVWPDDPRTEPGEVLWPAHMPKPYLDDKKVDLGSYGYAGQFQQRPSPAEGGILKREWWRYYDQLPQVDELIQSWDLAFKDTKHADFVVGQVWIRNGPNKYLVHQTRGRFDFPETMKRIEAQTAWVAEKFPNQQGHRILIEDAANGPAVIAALRRKLSGLVAVSPNGSKEARAHAVAAQIEAGNVYLPGVVNESGNGPDTARTAPWVQEFIEEATSFPNAAHDDQVDAMTQALSRLVRADENRRVRTGGYETPATADL